MTEIDTTRNDFIVGLEKYATITKIVVEGVDRWLDIKRIQPKGKDTGFALAFSIEVLNFEFFFFSNRVKARVCVEEIGNESKIKFGVTGYKGCG